jgi:hypothetical protein
MNNPYQYLPRPTVQFSVREVNKTGRWVQRRFPRSRKKRISNKWKKNIRNFHYIILPARLCLYGSLFIAETQDAYSLDMSFVTPPVDDAPCVDRICLPLPAVHMEHFFSFYEYRRMSDERRKMLMERMERRMREKWECALFNLANNPGEPQQ